MATYKFGGTSFSYAQFCGKQVGDIFEVYTKTDLKTLSSTYILLSFDAATCKWNYRYTNGNGTITNTGYYACTPCTTTTTTTTTKAPTTTTTKAPTTLPPNTTRAPTTTGAPTTTLPPTSLPGGYMETTETLPNCKLVGLDPKYYLDLADYNERMNAYLLEKQKYDNELIIYNNNLKTLKYQNSLIDEFNRVQSEIGTQIWRIDEQRFQEMQKQLIDLQEQRNSLLKVAPTEVFFQNSARNSLVTNQIASNILNTEDKASCLSNIISYVNPNDYQPEIVTIATMQDFQINLEDQVSHAYFLNDFIDELDTNNTFNLNNINRLTSGIVHNPMYMYVPMLLNPDLNPDLVFSKINNIGFNLDKAVTDVWINKKQTKVSDILENNTEVEKLFLEFNNEAIKFRAFYMNLLQIRVNLFNQVDDDLNVILNQLRISDPNAMTEYVEGMIEKIRFYITTDIDVPTMGSAIKFLETQLNDDIQNKLNYFFDLNRIAWEPLNDAYASYYAYNTIKDGIYLKILDNNFVNTITTYSNSYIGCRILVPLYDHFLKIIKNGWLTIEDLDSQKMKEVNMTLNNLNMIINENKTMHLLNLDNLQIEINEILNKTFDEDIKMFVTEEALIPNYCYNDKKIITNNIIGLKSNKNNDTNIIPNADPAKENPDISIPCIEPIDSTYEIMSSQDANLYKDNWNFSFMVTNKIKQLGYTDIDLQNMNIQINSDTVKLLQDGVLIKEIILNNTRTNIPDNPVFINISKTGEGLGITHVNNLNNISENMVRVELPIYPKSLNTKAQFCGDIKNITLAPDNDQNNLIEEAFNYKPEKELLYYNFKKLDNETLPVNNINNTSTNINIPIRVYSYNDNLPANLISNINIKKYIVQLNPFNDGFAGGLTDFFCKDNINQKNFTLSFWFKPFIYAGVLNKEMLISDDVNNTYVYYKRDSRELILQTTFFKKTYKCLFNTNEFYNIMFSIDYITKRIYIKVINTLNEIVITDTISLIEYLLSEQKFNFNMMSLFMEYDLNSNNGSYYKNFFCGIIAFVKLDLKSYEIQQEEFDDYLLKSIKML